jgi:hypothetical protein
MGSTARRVRPTWGHLTGDDADRFHFRAVENGSVFGEAVRATEVTGGGPGMIRAAALAGVMVLAGCGVCPECGWMTM